MSNFIPFGGGSNLTDLLVSQAINMVGFDVIELADSQKITGELFFKLIGDDFEPYKDLETYAEIQAVTEANDLVNQSSNALTIVEGMQPAGFMIDAPSITTYVGDDFIFFHTQNQMVTPEDSVCQYRINEGAWQSFGTINETTTEAETHKVLADLTLGETVRIDTRQSQYGTQSAVNTSMVTVTPVASNWTQYFTNSAHKDLFENDTTTYGSTAKTAQEYWKLSEPVMTEIATNAVSVNSVMNDSTTVNVAVGSQVAMNAMTSSQIAMNEIAVNQLAMDAMISTAIARDTMTESQIAMDTVAESQLAMDTVLADETTRELIVESQVSMNAVAASQLAMDTVTASQVAMDTVNASNLAIGKFVASRAGLDASEYADMNAVVASQLAMDTVTASQVAMDTVNASNLAIGKFVASRAGLDASEYADMNAVVASADAMDAVATSQIAMDAVVASALAMDTLAASEVAMDAVTDSLMATNKFLLSSHYSYFHNSSIAVNKFWSNDNPYSSGEGELISGAGWKLSVYGNGSQSREYTLDLDGASNLILQTHRTGRWDDHDETYHIYIDGTEIYNSLSRGSAEHSFDITGYNGECTLKFTLITDDGTADATMTMSKIRMT